MNINVINLKKLDYGIVLNIQEKLLAARQKDEIEDTLLLVEHPSTLTLGVRGKFSNILVTSAVLNSVTRDDLIDGGASHFAKVIKEIRKINKKVTIEVLIPDLQGKVDALQSIVDAKPDIIGHNIETVPRIFSIIRSMADYNRSLTLLKRSKLMDSSIYTKSAIMVGLGETQEEVLQVF